MAGFGDEGAFAVDAYVTGLTVIILLCQLLWRCTLRQMQRPPLVFLTTMAVSLTLRTIWLLLRAAKEGEDESTSMVLVRLVSRASILLYFTAYSTYTLTWADALEPFKLRRTRSRFSNYFVCVFSNILVYAATLALLVAAEMLPYDGHAGREVYGIDIFFVSVSTLCLVSVFLWFGCQLRSRLAGLQDAPALVKSAELKIRISTIVCGFSLFMRVIMFTWSRLSPDHKIVNASVDKFFYPWFFYMVPDVFPSLSMMMMMAPARARTVQAAKSLSLLRETQDDYSMPNQYDSENSFYRPPMANGLYKEESAVSMVDRY